MILQYTAIVVSMFPCSALISLNSLSRATNLQTHHISDGLLTISSEKEGRRMTGIDQTQDPPFIMAHCHLINAQLKVITLNSVV